MRSHLQQVGGLCAEIVAPVANRGAAAPRVSLGALADLGRALSADPAESHTLPRC